VLVDQGKLQEALQAYQQSLTIRRTLAEQDKSNSDWQRDLAVSHERLGDVLVDQGKLQEALDAYQQQVKLLRGVVSYQPGDRSRYRLASALGNLAFRLVLNSQFAEAQTRCEEAQILANEIGNGIQKSDRDDLIFIQQNLAHALLFQGHYDEALAIYRQYWDKPLFGKTFGEVTLEDRGKHQNR
jgi:tetratricopeptide (TPR) repeat protein